MINLKRLIDLLPITYKELDTYKNEEGEGILERFLQVCGDYFEDKIVPDINSIENLIDIDTTSPIYLNYIWELLGSIPFAYGVLLDTRLWDTYSKVSDNSEAWLKALETLPPKARPRDILKYAIPLYKIRGTLDFYNTLLGFYGFKCKISDPTGDYDNPHPSINKGDTIPYYDLGLSYDDNETYDVSRNCLSCVSVSLKVYTEIDFVGGAGAEIILEPKVFHDRLCMLLNRFRPMNVVPFSLLNVHIYNRTPDGTVHDYDDFTGYEFLI